MAERGARSECLPLGHQLAAERGQHGRGIGRVLDAEPAQDHGAVLGGQVAYPHAVVVGRPDGRVGGPDAHDVDAVGSGSRVERPGGGHRGAPSMQARQVGEHGMGTDLAQGDGSVQGDHQSHGGQGGAAEIGEVGVGSDVGQRDVEDLCPGGGDPPLRRAELDRRCAGRRCARRRGASAVSTLPLAVSGSSTTCRSSEGTMYGGRESASRPRRSWASRRPSPVTKATRRADPALSSTTTAAWRTPGSAGRAPSRPRRARPGSRAP